LIDTEALRKKIIDLAIQGKLTEQLPEDGDAESLYAKIQEEKAKLIKEGKIKKEKPLPVIDKDEIPFNIPDNWKWVRWGELSEKIQYGYNASAKTAGRIKMVRISDIQDGKVQWDTVPYCDIDESEINDYLLRENDILFARTGGTVGKSYIVSYVPEEAVFAGYLIRTSYSSAICASYMKYFMESGLYWKQLRDGTIATAQPNCNGKTLSKMIVPFPPYAEQKRISEIIEATFSQIDIIDTLQQQYESDLSVLKSKIIDAGIRGKLTEQLPEDGDAETLYSQIQEEKAKLIKEGKIKKEKPLPEISAEEITFEIPKNWKWVRLRDISRKIVDGDHNPPSGVKEKTDFLMLSAQNINDDRIVNIENARYLTEDVFVEENKRTRLEIGDVLLTIVATLGRSCVYREQYNVCFQRSVCVISPLINPDYLKRVFDSAYIQKLMTDNATGAAQPGFYLNKVERMCIPVPPIKEQEEIVKRIDEILQCI